MLQKEKNSKAAAHVGVLKNCTEFDDQASIKEQTSVDNQTNGSIKKYSDPKGFVGASKKFTQSDDQEDIQTPNIR